MGRSKLKRNSPVVIHNPEIKIVLLFSRALLDKEIVKAPISGVRIKRDKIGKLIYETDT